jgi:protein SCO1/2
MSARFIVFAATALAVFAHHGAAVPVQPAYTIQDTNLKTSVPGALQGVRIDQRLNESVPLNLTFTDESGRAVLLSSFFHRKPVLLALVYYRCPMLCTLILNGVVDSLKAVPFTPGRDFEVISVSFDPKDTPELAAAKKKMYLNHYGHSETADGWHFLTGDEVNIHKLTESVGFHYKYDPATQQFAHASGIMMLTPDGRLSRYFYGVTYSPRDLRLGLVEASRNKIGGAVEQILLFCYHYDATTGKYGAAAMNSERIGGAASLVIAGGCLAILWRRERDVGRHFLKRIG